MDKIIFNIFVVGLTMVITCNRAIFRSLAARIDLDCAKNINVFEVLTLAFTIGS